MSVGNEIEANAMQEILHLRGGNFSASEYEAINRAFTSHADTVQKISEFAANQLDVTVLRGRFGGIKAVATEDYTDENIKQQLFESTLILIGSVALSAFRYAKLSDTAAAK